MKYLLLCYDNQLAWDNMSQGEQQRIIGGVCRVLEEIKATGHYLSSSPLHPVATAKSVRVRNGKPLVTDGPFAETREQLGGYFLIEAKNLDEAIGIAARLPGSPTHAIEIRPVMEIPGLPTA